MSDRKTESILKRVPAILAVTAASYGLTAHGDRDQGSGGRRQTAHGKSAGPCRPAARGPVRR